MREPAGECNAATGTRTLLTSRGGTNTRYADEVATARIHFFSLPSTPLQIRARRKKCPGCALLAFFRLNRRESAI